MHERVWYLSNQCFLNITPIIASHRKHRNVLIMPSSASLFIRIAPSLFKNHPWSASISWAKMMIQRIPNHVDLMSLLSCEKKDLMSLQFVSVHKWWYKTVPAAAPHFLTYSTVAIEANSAKLPGKILKIRPMSHFVTIPAEYEHWPLSRAARETKHGHSSPISCPPPGSQVLSVQIGQCWDGAQPVEGDHGGAVMKTEPTCRSKETQSEQGSQRPESLLNWGFHEVELWRPEANQPPGWSREVSRTNRPSQIEPQPASSITIYRQVR